MEPEDAEALRRRLYRPGATAADLATYLHASTPAPPRDPEAHPEPEPGPSLRPFAVGASVVAGVALVGGLLLSGVLTPPTASPTVLAATPAATSAPTATVDAGSGQVEFVIATVLDGGSAPHARGTAVAEGPDRYRYTVAEGDTADDVAARFGLCTGDVLVALPYGDDPTRMQADQTVQLAKLTSTTC